MQQAVSGFETVPNHLVVAQLDATADIFVCRLAANGVGKRLDHARNPAAGFGQVGDFRLDDDGNALGQRERGAVDRMGRIDAYVHDDHAPGCHACFEQPAQDLGDLFFVLQGFVTQVVRDQTGKDFQCWQAVHRSE